MARVARTALQNRFAVEADIGAHGCSRFRCDGTTPHFASRLSFLYGIHRYVALGQQVAFVLDRYPAPGPYDSDAVNKNFFTGVDFRIRVPYLRVLFWMALTTGYHMRRFLSYASHFSSAHGIYIGEGVGVDVFINPVVAIGVSGWAYQGFMFEHHDEREVSLHWTVTAGVRLYLSRRAP